MATAALVLVSGSLCPCCSRGVLYQADDERLHCPMCGWYPGWREDRDRGLGVDLEAG